jgi:hypothetical protein
MRTTPALVLLSLCILVTPSSARTDDAPETRAIPSVSATAGNAWLMLVATSCTDPDRETDFNAWYDDIDIPDVLEVPGYERARRGLRLGTAAEPVAALPDDQGRYVALYDIQSGNIDKTIIEMLMATRKMESRGRTTGLLKVTERVYYLRLAPPMQRARHPQTSSADAASNDGDDDYLFVERIDCCGSTAAARSFTDWYQHEHVARVLEQPGFERATRYELYRVLMIEPKTATRYLTVYELSARSTDEALQRMDTARALLRTQARSQGTFAENGSLMFMKIRDVRRPSSAAIQSENATR